MRENTPPPFWGRWGSTPAKEITTSTSSLSMDSLFCLATGCLASVSQLHWVLDMIIQAEGRAGPGLRPSHPTLKVVPSICALFTRHMPITFSMVSWRLEDRIIIPDRSLPTGNLDCIWGDNPACTKRWADVNMWLKTTHHSHRKAGLFDHKKEKGKKISVRIRDARLRAGM